MGLNRRKFLQTLTAYGTLGLVPAQLLAIQNKPLTKPIPMTGEALPVIGMGTWITFNVGEDAQARNARTQVLETFLNHGGGMVDSSPMYGSAEAVMGYALERLGQPQKALFSATKVWTPFDGNQQVMDSHRLWQLPQLDLLQIHNLVAWKKHLPMLLEQKQAGNIRYVGITTSHGRRHAELEQIIRTQPIDFVQLTYNVLDRAVEQRLLPAAQEKGIAVIANRPFQGGRLPQQLAGQPLPTWAAEIDCQHWSQLLLKFIVSHSAITCAIPATSQVAHMQENMQAGQGRLPDQALRNKILSHIQAL